jgi:hypothetical protein
MKNYILRKIDDALWERVKARATQEGRPLRFVILSLLALYAERGFAVVEQDTHRGS